MVMTPEEQALELAKEAVRKTLEPVTDTLKALLGPAAEEIGLAWGDSFRVWRLKRIVRLLDEVKHVASNAGLKLKPVAPRVLFPLLEAASLEDDEDLHQRWVALLTNASTAAQTNSNILPCFPDILKQLTSVEAHFLDKAYDEITIDAERRRAEILEANPGFGGQIGTIRLSGKLLSSVKQLMIANMERLMLITRNDIGLTLDDRIVNTMPSANHLYLSEFGSSFVRACRLPNGGSTVREEKPQDSPRYQ